MCDCNHVVGRNLILCKNCGHHRGYHPGKFKPLDATNKCNWYEVYGKWLSG